jgi:hypothetical protein
MNFKFTKYGITNALLSLIPIFPVWTLFPGLLIGMGIEKCISDCISSYKIVLLLSICLVIILVIVYLFGMKKLLIKDPKALKTNFKLFSLLIYMMANTAAFIIILGPNVVCNGSSMSVMACVLSGPIASVVILILGFLIDLKLKIYPVMLNIKKTAKLP